jgi:hypothetical protein
MSKQAITTKKTAKRIAETVEAVATAPSDVIQAFKGFDKDMKCRGYQFALGQTYEHEGDAKLCSSGFHACTSPLDVLGYYGNTDGNQFARVELSNLSAETETDSKRAGRTIKIKAMLSIHALFSAHLEWVFSKAASTKDVATTGNSAHAATTGNYAHAATTGNSAHAATTGNYAHAATTGNSAHAATTGNSAHAATTGNSAHAATTGNYAHAATTGNSAHAATTGNYAHAATTGNSAHAATTGNYAHAATTGYYAHAATTGYYAHAATTGDSAHAATTGKNTIAASLGNKGEAKAGENGCLILGYFDSKDRPRVKVGYTGEDGILADRWYCLDAKFKFTLVAPAESAMAA